MRCELQRVVNWWQRLRRRHDLERQLDADVINVDKGFEAENVLAVDLAPSPSTYSRSQAVAFYQTLQGRVRALPGVIARGAGSALPLQRESDTTQVYLDPDRQYRLLERPVAAYRNVTTGYFATMGIPLLAGRFLAEDEPALAAVISVRLANALWPGSHSLPR